MMTLTDDDKAAVWYPPSVDIDQADRRTGAAIASDQGHRLDPHQKEMIAKLAPIRQRSRSAKRELEEMLEHTDDMLLESAPPPRPPADPAARTIAGRSTSDKAPRKPPSAGQHPEWVKARNVLRKDRAR